MEKYIYIGFWVYLACLTIDELILKPLAFKRRLKFNEFSDMKSLEDEVRRLRDEHSKTHI